jgi:hypothetical protein
MKDERAIEPIRALIRVLTNVYGIAPADVNDLLDRIAAWSNEQAVKQTRRGFRVIDGGKG